MTMSLLASLPIILLLFSLLVLKTTARKAGASAFLASAIIAVSFFGLGSTGLAISVGKGVALAIYVSLIITAAIYLYNIVNDLKAVDVISEHLVHHIQDPFVLFLLLAWLFSSFLQGIAGFGVPVAIVAPILLRLGYDPLMSVAAVLIGHCWSISFGSMGSSLFALSLVTSLAPRNLALWMGVYDMAALVFTGAAVAWLYGGWKSLRNGWRYILLGSTGVSAFMFVVISLDLTSLIGLISTIFGMVVFVGYYKFRNSSTPSQVPTNKMSFAEAILPYALIVVASVGLQFVPYRISILSFNFPAYETALGFSASAAKGFAAISLLRHPAPIILMCGGISLLYYRQRGLWDSKRFLPVVRATFDKCIPTFISLVFLVSTATIMMGSGMTERIAQGVASMTGSFYPLFAPFIGILGAFITGSNTNSNVIFGSFQKTIAETMQVNPVAMSGVQSIGGSVGCAVGPTQVLLGTSSVGLQGKESDVYKILVTKVLLLGLILGILNIVILRLI
ncbi:MAG TPA: hypothetical protein DCM24_01620 [Synergistaceae bacterium]|nr:hypothetical protein [Synergistaceae bacterium]